ncbi:MAG: hypothetical protein ACR2IT_09100, partial [Pirellulales bacterium]
MRSSLCSSFIPHRVGLATFIVLHCAAAQNAAFGHGVEYQLSYDPVGSKVQARQIVSTDSRPVTLT